MMLVAAAPGRAQHTHAIGIVHHEQGIVTIRQLADAWKISDVAVHRKDAIGGDDPETGVLAFLKRAFQAGQVAVRKAITPCFA